MKKSMVLIVILGWTGLSNVSFAEVEIKSEPLTWEKSAQLGGEELFNKLCAACHGIDGSSVAQVENEIGKAIPDLRLISSSNDGSFPHKRVEYLVAGKQRETSHDSIDMPAWDQQFMYVRTGLTSFQREAYARNRIHVLVEHIETLQLN